MLNLSVFFDVSTALLLVGGSVLLWSNLGGRHTSVVPAEETIIRQGKQRVDPVQNLPEQFAAEKRPEFRAAFRAGSVIAAPAANLDAPVGATPANQNHYATNVSAAMAKSRPK